MPSSLPELDALHRLIDSAGQLLDVRTACTVSCGQQLFEVPVVAMGARDPAMPAIAFFGGVHGLERIGSEVVIAFLRTTIERLRWDGLLHRQLEGLRIVFMPLVNPGGLWLGTRANPNGVDLMRNAPIDAQERVAFFVGGQRWSKVLPWFRGHPERQMEEEAQALCRVVEEELLYRPFSLALDCHSGFGVQDRIWFPYAHTSQPIEHLPELHALKRIFDQGQVHHPYVFEPQSLQYLTHGDLWDHLYQTARIRHPRNVFLPLTLEMGSWLWVKKNPRQLFNRHGIFNPLIDHRQQRVLRRHMGLLDFLTRACGSHPHWRPPAERRAAERALALHLWYTHRPEFT